MTDASQAGAQNPEGLPLSTHQVLLAYFELELSVQRDFIRELGLTLPEDVKLSDFERAKQGFSRAKDAGLLPKLSSLIAAHKAES
jgi:hypothetical protein